MRTLKYTFWQDGEFYLGYLNDYPDYQTQGSSKEELLENLKDLLSDLESREVPFIRKVEEMAIAS
jgi:predicted RNase H-like HicB family nuclease